MTDRELMQQALEALGFIYSPLHVREINKVGAAMNALRSRLAQPEQVPDDGYCKACDGWKCTSKVGCVALDNPPPQRKPLSPQSPCEMTQAERKMFKLGWLECEAAHNIKGKA